MQFDMFATDAPVEDPVDVLPEKMHADPVAMHAPRPDGGPQLEAWIRVTQRLYLLWLVGTIHRFQYRDSSIVNAREILVKLNGLGGEW